MYAFLADRFRLTPADVGRLTPVQIVGFYLPKRDAGGGLDLAHGAVGGEPVDVATQVRLRRFRLGLS
jgi:hypothetical protein